MKGEKEMYRILVAEDDRDIAELIRFFLAGEGYETEVAYDGEAALEAFRRNPHELILVDIMMPKMNGYELIREIRRESVVPMIILSAKSQNVDKIVGLESGADMYLTKPFDTAELLAAVRAVLRRFYKLGGAEGDTGNSRITVGDMTLDMNAMCLFHEGEQIPVTHMEMKLLSVLMHSPGKVFTKEQLARAVRSDFIESDVGVIAVHISRLRVKLEADPANPQHIKTLRGLGYKFEK